MALTAAFLAPVGASGLPGVVSGPCSGAGISVAPPSPHANNGTVVITGSATGPCVTNYRFWIRPPGGVWAIVQDYTASATYNWDINSIAIGIYNLEVDVRNDGYGVYDAVANTNYTITQTPTCLTANLTVAPVSPGATGGSFVMTGSSTGCPNPVYRFWIQDPGRAWSMVQDYSATTTHTWGPIGTYYIGQYRMEVDVRDATSSAVYDVVHNITYNLIGCSAGTLTAAPTTSVHGSVPVVLTATSTCPAGSTGAEYRFWIFDPGRRWSMVQDYSSAATFNWAAASTSAIGTYRLEVDIRNKGSFEVYEVVVPGTYTTT